ncbi:MAG TPA: NAD(P)/FAD-dependent oxidoreductase [Chloroflexota bacterium]
MVPNFFDAAVVGSGPNGLAAAVALARAGRAVIVLEAQPTIGGGCRSEELTLPGFVHDRCSAIMPMGVASRFLRSLPLHEHGFEWIHPSAPLAHPLDDGTAVVLEHSIGATEANLGDDRAAYRSLVAPFAQRADELLEDILGPIKLPRHPLLTARFGLLALRSAYGLAQSTFHGERARALFAGMAAHAVQPLTHPATAAFGLMFAMFGHSSGWPLVRGGSQNLTRALAAYLAQAGGSVVTNHRVASLDDVPNAGVTLLDLTPKQVIAITRDLLPAGYRRQLARYRYGPAVFKIDYALDGPIPWRAKECLRAGTVHLGGTLDEITDAEAAVWRGGHPERPFVILTQQSLFDPTRAPHGKHTLWAYCHVPTGSTVDMAERIEQQVERFAPGFRERILARSSMSPAQIEQHNANYIGGDISAGVHNLRQLIARPVARLVPYATPDPRIFLCSASTPPGAGVHGLCGYFAAQAVLRKAKPPQ